MSIAPGYTDDEVRAIVHQYDLQPHGTKTAWITAQGISTTRFRRWRIAVYDGDLDRGLIPRQGSPMTNPINRRKIAAQQTALETENEKLRAKIEELEAVNDALGKAIGLLHQLNEQEPDPPQPNAGTRSAFGNITSSPTSPK